MEAYGYFAPSIQYLPNYFYTPMNTLVSKFALLLTGWLLVAGTMGCNLTKDKTTTAAEPDPAKADVNLTQNKAVEGDNYEDFRNMSLEERWRSFTPERRNYLRQNPDLYAYYKPFIDAEPNFEPEGTIQYNTQLLPTINSDVPDKPKTPEEWWNSFSEDRKEYMRQNPQYYPEFVQFFNK